MSPVWHENMIQLDWVWTQGVWLQVSDEHYYPLLLITLGPFTIHLYKCPLSTLDTPHYSVVHIYTNYLNEKHLLQLT